ncbi:Wadjet anti-phage system protein JetD domain-containing protein [Kutzneria sp. CA-103260]|uniref:Wadjet anti-phage system protein JetD domain-containing protein n=1 Tax=Kutzneria sp. CA-103260 TaxID=2802641 RepID=UPI001BA7BC20|nr:Wadjet anti-phage system protein JetD domain-containing protein [Kutzneria sp. CA-103260]
MPLETVLTAAAAVDRTASASVHWRSRVMSAITSLAADGRVELPKTRFDSTTRPALPAYIQRPARHRPLVETREAVVWHADLAWAAVADDEGQLAPAERRLLSAVNAWLPHRRNVVVPLRERSLEILDDEKALESWVFGPLFGPGRLTFELLECEPCWPPVEQCVLGPGDWLIVENYTTYVSICRVARQQNFQGRIIWGAGLQVGTRLLALAAAGEHPTRCRYFGDVDTGGFQAARLAHDRAAMLDFPEALPARGLYRLAMTIGADQRRRDSRRSGKDLLAWTREWVGAPLADPITAVLVAGVRIVQENVGFELLRDTTAKKDWF